MRIRFDHDPLINVNPPSCNHRRDARRKGA
jgi:hypothetical protein